DRDLNQERMVDTHRAVRLRPAITTRRVAVIPARGPELRLLGELGVQPDRGDVLRPLVLGEESDLSIPFDSSGLRAGPRAPPLDADRTLEGELAGDPTALTEERTRAAGLVHLSLVALEHLPLPWRRIPARHRRSLGIESPRPIAPLPILPE